MIPRREIFQSSAKVRWKNGLNLRSGWVYHSFSEFLHINIVTSSGSVQLLAWLLPPCGLGFTGLGVFNFLLGNVIVGFTESQYGLRDATWITYGAALVLYGLRVMLKSVMLVNREGKEAGVLEIIWSNRIYEN